MSEFSNLVVAAVLLTSGDAMEPAARAFTELGFFPQAVAEESLLIAGTEALFEKRFITEIIFAPSGIMTFRSDDHKSKLSRGLPLDALEPTVQNLLRGACFEAPMELSPISFDEAALTAGREDEMTILSAAVLLKDDSGTQAAIVGFTNLGFEVQTISEGVLLLTAEASIFEESFGSPIKIDSTGAHVDSDGRDSRKLSTDALPLILQPLIAEVEFESPPDFGPTNY